MCNLILESLNIVYVIAACGLCGLGLAAAVVALVINRKRSNGKAQTVVQPVETKVDEPAPEPTEAPAETELVEEKVEESAVPEVAAQPDRKSTRLNSSHM